MEREPTAGGQETPKPPDAVSHGALVMHDNARTLVTPNSRAKLTMRDADNAGTCDGSDGTDWACC